MKNTLKVLLVLSLMLTSAATVMAEEDKGIGLTIDFSYMSDYLWRGTDWFSGDGAFFPALSFDLMGSGFTLSVAGELSEDYIFDGNDTSKDLQATDFGLDYSYSIGTSVTLGAGVWYFLLWDTDSSFMTFTGSAALDSLPLTPTISYTHDYYTGPKSVRGDDAGKDFYIKLALSHSFELMKDVGLDLGASAAYYHVRSFGLDLDGVSDIDLSTGLSVKKGMLTYSGGFHYVIVPSKDFYGSPKDINKFYATFGVSCSI